MSTVIPPAFAFQFALPVRRADHLPLKGARLLDLTDEFQVPWLDASLVGKSQVAGPTQAGVNLRLAWNERGVGIAFTVRGKSRGPMCPPGDSLGAEGLQVWLDTRNTQTIHRASRFCHHFCLLPAGDGDDGQQPYVRQLPIARAADDARQFESDAFLITSRVLGDGYEVEAWLPATTLTGFDVEVCSQLGFTCLLIDRELGDVALTVGTDFPIASDPSLWQTLDLV